MLAINRKPWSRGLMFPAYIAGYGAVRFIVEFFREPDSHIGFVVASFSMGQVLCFVMIAAGIGLALYQRWAWRSGDSGD